MLQLAPLLLVDVYHRSVCCLYTGNGRNYESHIQSCGTLLWGPGTCWIYKENMQYGKQQCIAELLMLLVVQLESFHHGAVHWGSVGPPLSMLPITGVAETSAAGRAWRALI